MSLKKIILFLVAITILAAIIGTYCAVAMYPPSSSIHIDTYSLEVNGSVFTYFASRQELVDFILEDKTDEIPYSQEFDCEDFAIELQRNAMRKGKIMNIVPINPKDYNTMFGGKLGRFDQHIINSTICGTGYYAEYVVIDSQTDEIRRVGFLGR